MNIYALFPLIAIIAYISLLVTTIGSRPWRRQHKLFVLFLFASGVWSFTSFMLVHNPSSPHLIFWNGLVITAIPWAAICYYHFVRAYNNKPGGIGLYFGYAFVLTILALCLNGYVVKSAYFINGFLYHDIKPWDYIVGGIIFPFLLTAMLMLVQRYRTSTDPTDRNRTMYLIIGSGIAIVGGYVTSFTPALAGLPTDHLGNFANALIIAYAIRRYQLVGIRLVLRRALGWLTLGIAGAGIYLVFLFLLHLWIGFELGSVALATAMAAVLVAIIVYLLRDVSQQKIDQVFYRKTYDYRQQLSDFVSRIHNVFGLRELSGELLSLIVNAIKCQRACLLFPEAGSGDFIPQFVEPPGEDNPLSRLRIKQDNPIVRYLSRKPRLLTIQNLDILPEFYSLWEQEKEEIKAAQIELFMPVISRGRLVSILILSQKQSGRYLLEDISLLEDVISRVAVSVERGYLHEEVRQRQEELSLISHLAAIMTSSLDITEIYDSFIKELRKVIDVDWAAIVLVEGDELNLLALTSEIGSAWQTGDRLPLKGTATEWVVTHKAALIVPNLTEESRFWTGKYHLKQGVQSLVFLPLLVNDKTIGSLVIASRRPNAYSQSQVQLLSQLASRIAMPIENARLYAQAEQMGRIDQLTGLWNRRHLEERIQVEIGRHSRYGGTFSLIILDLDSFKAFNDSYGHLAGDKLLRQLGSIMKGAIRSADEAFRYGGDEFAILLPQTSIREAYEVAERVRSRIASEIKVGHTSVTASLGLAGWPADGVRINEIITAADMALYRAKQSGGNQIQAISETLPPLAKPATKLEIRQDRGALSIIYALAAAVDTKDHYASNHSQKVKEYAVALAKNLDLESADIARLSTCALLHDIGKIGISDEIINKPDGLNAEEWEIIKSHPQLGADIISHVPQLASCLTSILYHHERYDGRGYPSGLKGEAIPLDARILGIVDAFAAMTSVRPYRDALSFEQALEELKRGAGTQFDPHLVETFLSVARTISPVATQ